MIDLPKENTHLKFVDSLSQIKSGTEADVAPEIKIDSNLEK